MPHNSTCTEMTTEDTNVPTHNDKYPWLDPEDKRWHMTDAEILRMKLNLADCAIDDKGKEEFLAKSDPYPMHEEQKKVIQKEMDRLKHLGII